jgi:hypothetical protein
VDTREAMYVGDNPRADVEPAKRLGMVSVWMRRSGRHTLEPQMPQPDYQIRNFHELRDLLVRDFNVKLASEALKAPAEPMRAKRGKETRPGEDQSVGAADD